MTNDITFFKNSQGEVYRIETKDTIIRTALPEDIADFFTWERDRNVTEFFSIADNHSLEEVWRTYIHDDEDSTARQFTILKKKNGKKIGRIVITNLIEGWKAEIFRIYIAELSNRGKGYGFQAMLAIMKLCFEEYKCERVYLDHYTGNPAGELYQSLGFKYEGVLRSNCRKNGKLYDVHLMSMLGNEYNSLYKTEKEDED